MKVYMVRHKLTRFWLLKKTKRKRSKDQGNVELWTNNVKNASIWLRRHDAIKDMRTSNINKESELVEFELQEL